MANPDRPQGGKVKHPHFGLLLAGLLALLLVCASLAGDYGQAIARLQPGRPPKVDSVHFQYQRFDFGKSRILPVGALVVDPDDSGLKPEQIGLLKQMPDGGRRIILAYLSVGQAEDYRAYWELNWHPGSPSFIGPADPQWPGTYQVKYWNGIWRRAMAKETARLAAAGYDGVVLDRVDAYKYWKGEGVTGAAGRMISLVRKIKAEGRKKNPDFLVVPLNAPELYAERRWQNLVDGLGKENTWFIDGHRRQPMEVFEDSQWLDQALGDGKFILALDYPTSNSDVCDFYRMCAAKNYACIAANRALDLSSPLSCQ